MSGSERRWELDALRGVMLVAMTLTHLPTRFSDPTGQPLGFVSAAEGFVMLSAYMAGIVYTQREARAGAPEMRSAFLRRAGKIYLCQAALLVFAFSIVAFLGVQAHQPAITNLLSFYLDRPLKAFLDGILLLYNPPLLDILPMYILFMLLSPVLLLHGLRHGWTGIVVASLLLWLAAQFDLGTAGYNVAVRFAGLKVPHEQTGSFQLFGWQFLWVLGLWMGSVSARPQASEKAASRFPPWMVRAAAVYALICFVWRHAVGQAPFLGAQGLNMLFDKWTLGPLRLLDFLALLLLTMHFGPWLKAHLPRWRVLEKLGAAALPVFCAHLVLALLILASFGEANPERPVAVDVALLVGSFAALYAVAWVSGELDRRSAALRSRVKEQAASRLKTLPWPPRSVSNPSVQRPGSDGSK